jgi:deoxyribonuclease-4
MSGKGSECGYEFNQIKKIIDGVKDNKKVLVCMDTCHLHDAGYDLSHFDKILDDFDKIIGLNKLSCIHINDSKNAMGSKKDRHENIGFGYIGFDTIIDIIYNKRIENIPKILETPYISESLMSDDKIYPPYKFEIEMIKNKAFNKNMLEDIRNYYKKTN